MDYVIPYKRSRSFDKELRYCLRSLSNMEMVERVYLIGEKPQWVQGVEFIPMTQTTQKGVNTRNALIKACESNVSDDFILGADDIFATKPHQHVTLYHGGPLKDFLEKYSTRYPNSYYTRKIKKMAEEMPGILNHYELHVPMVVNKQHSLSLLTNTDFHGMMFRTLYGNIVYGGQGEYTKDVKHYRRTRDEWYKDIPIGYLSSDDMAFNGQVEKYLKGMFPKRSKYEKY